MGVRDIYCEHCRGYTPHMIFVNFLGKVYKCLICTKERIEEPEHD